MSQVTGSGLGGAMAGQPHQFHQTSFVLLSKEDRCPLASEAVAGRYES